MSSPAVLKDNRRVAGSASPGRPQAASARFWRIKSFCRNRAAMIAAIFLSLVALAVIFAPQISGHSPDEADNLARYAPIGTPGYILGTDQQGRDTLARLLYGGRVSLLVGGVPTLTAGAIGLALGLLAGFLRGVIDQVIMRCLDVVFAFPMVLLAIAIAGAIAPGEHGIISITIILIPISPGWLGPRPRA